MFTQFKFLYQKAGFKRRFKFSYTQIKIKNQIWYGKLDNKIKCREFKFIVL